MRRFPRLPVTGSALPGSPGKTALWSFSLCPVHRLSPSGWEQAASFRSALQGMSTEELSPSRAINGASASYQFLDLGNGIVSAANGADLALTRVS